MELEPRHANRRHVLLKSILKARRRSLTEGFKRIVELSQKKKVTFCEKVGKKPFEAGLKKKNPGLVPGRNEIKSRCICCVF